MFQIKLISLMQRPLKHCRSSHLRTDMIGLRGVPKNVTSLCGCCGGAVDLIILVFTQLHRSGFNLEFETLYESV